MASSRELLKEQRAGAQILHNGAPVTFDPRRPRDPKPWVWRGYTQVVRYGSDQCQAYYPPDDACLDADGNEHPEHDFGETECRRCGAEAEE